MLRPAKAVFAVSVGLTLPFTVACATSPAGKIASPRATSAQDLPRIGASRGWRLVQDESFSQPALNNRLWSIGDPWEAGKDYSSGPASICPAAEHSQLVRVHDGMLDLLATKDTADSTRLNSCTVTTRNHYSFVHGYLEARVQLPSSPGLWPAFWLLGNGTGAHGWPGTGEVDIAEFINNGTDNGVPYVTVHYAGACTDNHCIDQPTPAPAVSDPNGRWLTLGLLRTSAEMRFFCDGKSVAVLKRGELNKDGNDGVALPGLLFDSPMQVRLDLKAGGWAADPKRPAQPGIFSIDYVRAWSR